MRPGIKGQNEKDEEEAGERKREETEEGGKGQLPIPPYTSADKAEDGLRCFYEGCAHKNDCYGNLLSHVINFHGRKLTDLKGSYLYSQGMQENMKKQASYRRKKKQTKTLTESGAKPIADINKLNVGASEPRGRQVPEDPTCPAKVLCEMWSYKEFSKWLDFATQEVTKVNYVAAEMSSRIALLEGIPLDVRRTMKLPTTTADEGVLKLNAERHGASIENMVREVTRAWMNVASTVDPEQLGLGIKWELEHTGLVPALLQHSKVLDEEFRHRLCKHLQALDNSCSAPAELERSRSICVGAQTKLLKDLLSKEDSAHLFTLAFEFVDWHIDVDPHVNAIRCLFEEMKPEARAAVGLPDLEEYVHRKPRGWQNDVSQFLSVAYFATIAWTGEGEPAPEQVEFKQSARCNRDPELDEKEGEMKNEAVGAMGAEEAKDKGADAKWLAIECWVKCDLDGTQLEPYTYGGPCHSTPKPGFNCKGRL